MERSRITPYAILLLVWGYLYSVVLAQHFWGAVFGRLTRALDLSPNEVWILPLGANLIVGAIAVLPVVKYLLLLRRRVALTAHQQITLALSSAGFCLCLWGAAGIAFSKPKQLASAVGEIAGGKGGNLKGFSLLELSETGGIQMLWSAFLSGFRTDGTRCRSMA